MIDVAAFAASEFKRRQAFAQDARDKGMMARLDAETHLWPWLAIACAVGAELPELYVAGKAYTVDKGWHDVQCRFLACELCDPADYREVLARARDAALNRNRSDDYAHGIVALADALRCRPFRWNGLLADAGKAAA